MHVFLQVVAWVVALVWVWRGIEAGRGLPQIPDLLEPQFDRIPEGMPTLTVVVPARNEQGDIRECLESLLAQDYEGVQIIGVDDRSSDETGRIMDALAAQYPLRLRVLHITDLPGGWLGKTHAMARAAGLADSEFLLFTDADILFRPDTLRRAIAHAVEVEADHLVVFPTTIIRRWDEAALLAFFQMFGLWAARPWKVADPRADDAIGIGAFNLIRTGAYRELGGFEGFPMEIVEDLGLARRVKWAGLSQRVAFGRGLVRVHWASGVPGLIRVMTKNIFSAFNFHVSLLLMACGWLLVFCALPFAAVFVRGSMVPGFLTVAAILYSYRLMSRCSGLSAWNGLLAPFAAVVFMYALCRSMVVTLVRGGVTWRGTFYPLAELRSHTVPLIRRR